jgi:hypothetical protein
VLDRYHRRILTHHAADALVRSTGYDERRLRHDHSAVSRFSVCAIHHADVRHSYSGCLDWLWLVLAFILDIASIGAAGAANRNRIPAGYPGSYEEKELAAPSPAQPGAATPPTPAAPDQPTESKPQ